MRALYLTDPFCARSWAAEPAMLALRWEFGEQLELWPVMGGLARAFGPEHRDAQNRIEGGPAWQAQQTRAWLEPSAASRMPVDPRVWAERPPASSYPSCMAVVAAREQGAGVAMAVLRRLRLAIFCERVRLDSAEAILAQLADLDGLDLERLRLDLGSTAIMEGFGADLERAREVSDRAREAGRVVESDGRERLCFPALLPLGGGDEPKVTEPAEWVWAGPEGHQEWRRAVLAAGLKPQSEQPLEPVAALRRYGRLATPELVELARRPGPVVEAELWRLACEWQIQPVPVLSSNLWQAL